MRFRDYAALGFRSLRRARLRSGLTISALPKGLQLVAQTDPLRIERRLLRVREGSSAPAEQFERDWVSCDLVP